MTLQYKKDKNSIISASFIEQQKGPQVHAHDLPHSLEVPAADTHEDHRALFTVLEEKGHCCRSWCQHYHGLAYTEGSSCTDNYKNHDERKPAKEHASDSSLRLVLAKV